MRFPEQDRLRLPGGDSKAVFSHADVAGRLPLPSTAVKLPAPTHLMLGLHATLTSTAEGVTTLFAAT